MAGDDEARARATLVEMQMRLSQGPHVALGVAEITTAEQVRAAFLELTKIYHPARFARMAPELHRMSNEVFLGIKSAHESLMRMLGSSLKPRATGTQTTTLIDPGTGRRSTSQIPTNKFVNPGTQPGVARTQTPLPGRTPTPSNNTPPPRITPAFGIPIRATPPAPAAPAKPTPPTGVAVPRTLTPHRALTPTQQRPSTPSMRPGTPPATQKPGDDPGTTRGQGVPPAKPVPPAPFDERTAYNEALTLLNKQQWSPARLALHQLAARVPQSRQYRALLCYARGREAAAAGRPDDASQEYQRALQLDPELAQAKQALAELRRR